MFLIQIFVYKFVLCNAHLQQIILFGSGLLKVYHVYLNYKAVNIALIAVTNKLYSGQNFSSLFIQKKKTKFLVLVALIEV